MPLPDFAVNIASKAEDNISHRPTYEVHSKDIADPVAHQRASDVLSLEQDLLNVGHKADVNVNNLISAKDPLTTADANGVVAKKSKKQLCDDIKALEDKLGVSPKGLSRFTREELNQYMTELIDKAGKVIQEEKLIQQISTTENVSDAKTKMVAEIKKDMTAAKATAIDNTLIPSQGAEFLYRMNFTTFFLLEKISMLTEERTGLNVVGIVDKLEEDKVKVLMPIYQRLFVEHREAIVKYGSPMMELTFYMITNIGAVAAANMKKKLANK